MAIDLASNSLMFFLVSLLELIFIAIPLLVFKIQKKDLKYEFCHRIIPEPRRWKRRVFDVGVGILLGLAFVFIGSYVAFYTRLLVVRILGESFYASASAGSVNTSPPSLKIWELMLGVVVMFALVGLSEEFCFRGVLFKEMGKRRPLIGALGSSFFFAIYHVFPGVVPISTFVTFWFYYFLFGVLLAAITHFQKGDLITAIIAHGTFNSLLWILAYT
jgi:membrane protease YdiL (CAAX protease family)